VLSCTLRWVQGSSGLVSAAVSDFFFWKSNSSSEKTENIGPRTGQSKRAGRGEAGAEARGPGDSTCRSGLRCHVCDAIWLGTGRRTLGATAMSGAAEGPRLDLLQVIPRHEGANGQQAWEPSVCLHFVRAGLAFVLPELASCLPYTA
jgi:hypothetical protein